MTSVVNEIASLGMEFATTTTTTAKTSAKYGDGEQIAFPQQKRLIYEQLIDMQFERLVSENAQLKVRLHLLELQQPQPPTGS